MNDEKVHQAIKTKDEQVMAMIMNKYSKLLWKIAVSVLANVGSVQDVEECVADVFIDFWLQPDKYDSGKGKLSSWFSMVARTKSIDRYRQIVRKNEVSIEEEVLVYHSEILTGILQKEEVKKLVSCVDKLELLEREILLRRYYYEQKPKEIAITLNLSRKQVENYLFQTKRKLKRMME